MNYKQNEKINQIKEESIIVGIDMGSQEQYVRMFDWRGRELGKVFKFENSRAGFKEFKDKIVEVMYKSGKKSMIVGMEPTGHYWFTFWKYLKENEIQSVLVSPAHVKKTKELDDNNPTKSDRKDPKTIAKLVIEGRYNEPYVPEKEYGELREILQCRRGIIKSVGQIKNRVARWITIYFPEYREVFKTVDGKGSIEILKKGLLPKDIVNLGVKELILIWKEKKIGSMGVKRATRLYEAAIGTIGCHGGEAARIEMKILIEELENKKKYLEIIFDEVKNLLKRVPESDKLLKVFKEGIILIATIISEIGDIKRFTNAKQIQKLAGLSIKENSSGKSIGKSSISKRGRSKLRAALFMATLSLIRNKAEFKELHLYYTKRPENSLKKMQSIIALSCKFIRVLFVILTKGKDYDGIKMTSDIKREIKLIAA